MLDNQYPFNQICQGWISKLTQAARYKHDRFGRDAEDCLRFFGSNHDFMYDASHYMARGLDASTLPKPWFRMTFNIVAEMVQLFGPVLYHRNPVRTVTPRKIPFPFADQAGLPDPMMAQLLQQAIQQTQQERQTDQYRAQLLQSYLNFTPDVNGLKDESRQAIDEALITGIGLLWTEVVSPLLRGGRTTGSFWDTQHNLLIDPDMETIKNAQWIARRCIRPRWEIERTHMLPPDTLRQYCNLDQGMSPSGVLPFDPARAQQLQYGQTSDLCVYWKIYSRMGIGGRLQGQDKNLSQIMDQFGDYCYLEIVNGLPYPLNLPPQAMQSSPQEVYKRLEWPIPFWVDEQNPWPFTEFAFHRVPRCCWPMSHVKPGMGELKFLNWAYSFLAGKIRTTCRDFIAILKEANEEIKTTIEKGQDLTIIEINSMHGTIDKVVQFLQHPSMQGDIWRVIETIQRNLEKRLGLTELMYAMTAKSMRSAEEANIKEGQMNVRPDDMARIVEDTMTVVAKKEAIAACYALDAQQDLAPIMGQFNAQWWQQLVTAGGVPHMAQQLEYRIEAGSMRKPNKDKELANVHEAMQLLLPILQATSAQTMDFRALNNLLADWAVAMGLDPARYQITPPPPPLPPSPEMTEEHEQVEERTPEGTTAKVTRKSTIKGTPNGAPQGAAA